MREVFRRQKIDLRRLPDTIITKWSPETLVEGFVPFPKRLLRCVHQLFEGPKAIEDLAAILAVVDYRRPQISRPPSVDFLAFLAGLSNVGLRSALTRLEGKGFVEISGSDEGLEVETDGLLDAIVQATQDPKR